MQTVGVANLIAVEHQVGPAGRAYIGLEQRMTLEGLAHEPGEGLDLRIGAVGLKIALHRTG